MVCSQRSGPRCLFVAFLFALAALAGPCAQAHTALTGTDPAAGAVLATAPAEVVIQFNQAVNVLAMLWFLPDGTNAAIDVRVDGSRIEVTPKQAIPRGTHTIFWRVAADDGHPVAASLTFTFGASSKSAGRTPTTTASATWAAGSRYLFTISLAMGVGGAVFMRVIDLDNRSAALPRRLVLLISLSTLPLGALVLATCGLDMKGLPITGLASPDPWGAVWHAPVFNTVSLGIVAGAFAVAGLARSRYVVIAAWAMAALSFAVSGHAAQTDMRWLTAPAMFLHAAAMIYWIGALLPLALTAGQPGIGTLLTRFSGLAVPLVVVLIASGAIMTFAHIGDPAQLGQTGFGQLLAVKLLLVFVLLTLAGWNRLRLTPAIMAGEARASRAFMWSVRLEMLLGLAILLLASSFRLAPPP